MFPTLFVSHGAPTLPLTEAPAKRFLQQLGRGMPRLPKAILVISAHWETPRPRINFLTTNSTIHDFTGFQPELYSMGYPAPGSSDLAHRVTDLLTCAGFDPEIDTARGLDHGAWVPLMLMYPAADIPVTQLSVQSGADATHHLALGRALAPLAREDVLIVGSGSLTHSLSDFARYRDAIAEPEPIWVAAFADWIDLALSENRIDDLLSYRADAPYAQRNHPTEEHLMPLFVALGAAGEPVAIRHCHASTTHGVLRMDVYSFAGPN